MASDTIPGMAEAIEQRRLEVGLGVSEFARASGVTIQGLAPVRRGERRAYQEKVRLGVARALDWPDDALERLMAGEDPSTFKVQPSTGMVRAGDRLDRIEQQLEVLAEQVTRLAELELSARRAAAESNGRPRR